MRRLCAINLPSGTAASTLTSPGAPVSSVLSEVGQVLYLAHVTSHPSLHLHPVGNEPCLSASSFFRNPPGCSAPGTHSVCPLLGCTSRCWASIAPATCSVPMWITAFSSQEQSWLGSLYRWYCCGPRGCWMRGSRRGEVTRRPSLLSPFSLFSPEQHLRIAS